MKSEAMDVSNGNDDDLDQFILTKFSHLEEVEHLIANVENVVGSQHDEERWEDRMQYIFNLYQDQPHLLDPHLENLLKTCIDLIGKPKKITPRESIVFRFIYLMTKTRGYKVVIKLMPHEVSDLEPVLLMLSGLDPEVNENWQARYVLLLWLSIVTIIPFDMELFDVDGKTPMATRIVEAGKHFLLSKDVSQIAAAFMLSRFVSRPDAIVQGQLKETIEWTIYNIKNADMGNINGHNFMCGLLRFFTYLFKFGKREDILPYSTMVLQVNNCINALNWDREILLCRLRTKLVQRIGLVFLKMRVISWRYERGNRTLLDTLNNKNCLNNGDSSVVIDKPKVDQSSKENDDDIEVSEHLDEVIDFLINSLRNYFTTVRWSAAKGIGRICSRLPKSLADDVVEAILVLFSRLEAFSSWHGGCLALAELGRRGLLLPSRLPEVLPLILKALVYDEKSGECSYGSNVRDAACYVCWSFARAYRPEEMAPYVMKIASALIMMILFDREVNVRRAASAAFQENVGRQGQFPHGIDILTTCDYFAVGNLTNCYLQLSVFIASFDEYIIHMIDHLMVHKVGHWDYDIRELTSKTMAQLFRFAPDYVIEKVLPNLMETCIGMDLYRRQGSILCVAELVRAIKVHGREVPESIQKSITGLNGIMSTKMQFRGLSGELMRRSVCHLIRCCSEAALNLDSHKPDMIDIWYKFLTECTAHKEKLVRAAAIDAFPVFLQFYSIAKNGNLKMNFIDGYVNDVKAQIIDTNIEYIQIANLVILGKTPKDILLSVVQNRDDTETSDTLMFHGIINSLLNASRSDIQKSNKWGEARSKAVTAIVDVCESVGVENKELSYHTLLMIYSTLLRSLDDYTFDSHGDIGALLREAAMRAISRLTKFLLANSDSIYISIFDEELSTMIMTRVAQQAMEKIDRVRRTAGKVFYDLIHLSPVPLPHIPHHDRLKEIFDKNDCSELYWAAPHLTFPLFCQLMQFDEYRYRCVLGLVVSVGGITERTVQQSREALHHSIQIHDTDTKYLSELTISFLAVFSDYLGQDRVTIPLLKTIESVLSHPDYSDWFMSNSEDEFITSLLIEIIEKTKEELSLNNGCKDVQKIKSAIEVFCQMLQFPDNIRKMAIPKLMVLLGHKFPIIRKHTASYLYQSLLTYDSMLEDDKLDDLMNILQDTEWDRDLQEVRKIRNQVCEIFDVKSPNPLAQASQAACN